ncbi:MAG: M56 family metallopeptidase [Limisphaerales bacterium]
MALEFGPGNKPGTSSLNPQTSPGIAKKMSAGRDQFQGSRKLSAHFSANWLVFGFVVWGVGVVLVLLSVVVRQIRLRKFPHKGQLLRSADWTVLLEKACETLRLRRDVILLQTSENVIPLTWGWWRPVVLLPADAEHWPQERRRIVLLHELAHVKRWDCLTQLAASVVCAFYWFNPLVWLAVRRMGIERERACDDLVLSGGCKASEYAGHLVEIAGRFPRVPQVAAIAMARPSGLEQRIAAIVDTSRARCLRPVTMLAILAVVGGILFSVGGCKTSGVSSRADRYVRISAVVGIVETDVWRPSVTKGTNTVHSSTNRWTVPFVATVGTKEWQLDGDFTENGREKWFCDGTNITQSIQVVRPPAERFRTNKFFAAVLSQPDKSRVTVNIHETPGGYPPGSVNENIAWLAFCSGTYLKRSGRIIPLPAADIGHAPDDFAYPDKTETFQDGLGLPRKVELYVSQERYVASVRRFWPKAPLPIQSPPDRLRKFHYIVTESTNFLGWHFPLAFEFAEDTPEDFMGVSWRSVHGSGRVTAISESAAPQGVFDASLNQTVIDWRFSDLTNHVNAITYRWTNAFVPATNTPLLQDTFGAMRERAARRRSR